MFSRTYVPDSFGAGILVPLIKGEIRSNLNDISNYKPITLTPIISKLLKCVLLDHYKERLRYDNLQFAFK
jgi:hypothetical protein